MNKSFENYINSFKNKPKPQPKEVTNEELFSFYKKELDANGYCGIDFRMAVLCILAKRNKNLKVEFMQGESKLTYENKLDMWACKRHFGELYFDTEDQILEHARKCFKERTKYDSI